MGSECNRYWANIATPAPGPSGRACSAHASRRQRACASPGGDVELTLDTTQIKLFDPNGGRSLTYTGNGATSGARAAGATA